MGWFSHRGQRSFISVGYGDKAGRTTLVPYVVDRILVVLVAMRSLSKPADF